MSLPPPDPFEPASADGAGPPQSWQRPPTVPAGPPQSGAPPWGSQQQWAGGPPPSNGGGKTKWLVGGLAVVLAIALAVVITVLVVKPDSGGNGPSNAGAKGAESEFASANDTGPVNIITEDPTCAAWEKVGQEYADKLSTVGWDRRDSSVPAPAWTPEQRSMYEAASRAMLHAANRTVDLVTRTPHRAVRELYQQFIAYVHAFVSGLDSYSEAANDLVVVTDSSANALSRMCAAIGYGSASAVAPFVSNPTPPSSTTRPEAPGSPARFLISANEVCSQWSAEVDKASDATTAWQNLDANVPAAGWAPEQRAIVDAVMPVMLESADQLEHLGRQSGNPVLEDFAVLAAQYRRAYVKALPTYASRDNFLAQSATYLVKTVNWACKAAS